MARPIDGDALKRWCEKIIDQACHPATVQIGEVFLEKVRSMPTLPQPSNEALTGWVSVKERLPECCKDVLAYYENGKIDIDWVDSISCWCYENIFGSVTHWMPLPEPPDRRPPEGEA